MGAALRVTLGTPHGPAVVQVRGVVQGVGFRSSPVDVAPPGGKGVDGVVGATLTFSAGVTGPTTIELTMEAEGKGGAVRDDDLETIVLDLGGCWVCYGVPDKAWFDDRGVVSAQAGSADRVITVSMTSAPPGLSIPMAAAWGSAGQDANVALAAIGAALGRLSPVGP